MEEPRENTRTQYLSATKPTRHELGPNRGPQAPDDYCPIEPRRPTVSDRIKMKSKTKMIIAFNKIIRVHLLPILMYMKFL